MNIIVDENSNLQEAINHSNPGDTIFINCKKIHEKITVKQNDITIIGKGQEKSSIFFDDHYYKIADDNKETNTFRTYTVKVLGNNVTIKDLSIINTSTPSSIYGQAVALHVMGTNFKMENCKIVSAQDTLFTGPYPDNLKTRYQGFIDNDELMMGYSKQLYYKTTIVGDTDFIFGSATALFLECDIISSGKGYVAAPSQPQELDFGYLFLNCNFKSEVPCQAFLARPWRDYGAASFINCKMDNHIIELGYNKWNNTNRDKTARFAEYPPIKGRVSFAKMLTEKEASNYVTSFLDYLNMNINLQKSTKN